MRQLHRRCRYVCSVHDKEGHPEFVLKIVEKGFEDVIIKDNSPKCKLLTFIPFFIVFYTSTYRYKMYLYLNFALLY